MGYDYAPPGRPHVIRWRSPRLATVEDGGATLAMLQIAPGGRPEYEILREPATTEGKAQLLSCLVWALEQYEGGVAGPGDD
jgi:hypothetical protein